MSDALDPSPFAEFAVPKKSAVEQWREQQQHAGRVRRRVVQALGCLVVGAALGSTTGIAVSEGLQPLPLVIVGAFLGTMVGLLIGLLIGGACFSVMAMSRSKSGPSFEAQLTRRDPMSVITVLLLAWGLMGAILGAAAGGLEGVAWFLGKAAPDADFPGALAGTFAGVAVTGIGWFWWLRTRARGS